MQKVLYDDGANQDVLYAVGVVPSAPLYVSFGCRGTFVYKSYDLSLILKDIQVNKIHRL
jgi:hypothetical protein